MSSTPPEVAQVARPTRHTPIRTDLNRWVALASGVISTLAVLSAWGRPQFGVLVALWTLHGLAGAVLGQQWKREGVNPPRMILLSTLVFVPITAAMVVADGGLASPMWLVLLVGTLSSSFALEREAYIALAVSTVAMTGALLVPGWLERGFLLQDLLHAVLRSTALVFVWLLSHRIVRQQYNEAQARLASEQRHRERVMATAAVREQTRQQQKMEALGRLAGGVAHDFNNLLTVILNVTETLKTELGPDDVHSGELQDLLDASTQAASLTQQLLRFSRGGSHTTESVEVASLVDDVGRMLSRVLPSHIRLTVELPDQELVVLANRNELTQVLMNLAINARDAMEQEGELTITIAHRDFSTRAIRDLSLGTGSHVQISVRDTGVGMSPDVQMRAMEPFFTTKADGLGTGIGLASAYTTVTRYGGSLVLDSEPGDGTRVDVYLPLQHSRKDLHPNDRPVPTDPASSPSPRREPATISVFVVDDDARVRRVVTRLLQKSGFEVTPFANPIDFLEMTRDGPSYDALVTDINMPEMSGVDLVRHLERSGHVRPTVFISGYFAEELDLQEFKDDCYGFLSKPVARQKLADALHDCIRRYRPPVAEPPPSDLLR